MSICIMILDFASHLLPIKTRCRKDFDITPPVALRDQSMRKRSLEDSDTVTAVVYTVYVSTGRYRWRRSATVLCLIHEIGTKGSGSPAGNSGCRYAWSSVGYQRRRRRHTTTAVRGSGTYTWRRPRNGRCSRVHRGGRTIVAHTHNNTTESGSNSLTLLTESVRRDFGVPDSRFSTIFMRRSVLKSIVFFFF